MNDCFHNAYTPNVTSSGISHIRATVHRESKMSHYTLVHK